MQKRQRLKLPHSFHVEVSPQSYLAVTLGRKVVVIDTVEFKKISSTFPISNPSSACFNQDSSRLAIKNTFGRIVVIDPLSGDVLIDFENEAECEGAEVQFSFCGDYLVDASWGGKIYVRGSRSIGEKQVFSFNEEMITCVSTSKNCLLWLFTHQPKTRPGENFAPRPYLSIWEWPLFKVARRLDPQQDIIRSAALSPDGLKIAVIGYSRIEKQATLRILDVMDGGFLQVLLLKLGHTSRIRWSPDGHLLGSVQGEEIVIYRSKDLSELVSFDVKSPYDVGLSIDHSFIVLGSLSDSKIQRFDTLIV